MLTSVRMKILHIEYCSYPTFVVNYEKYANNEKYTSHIVHKPGETIEVDWSGSTMSYYDKDNNKKITAYLFVSFLPYSQKIYVEATTSMNQEAWMNCNVNMLTFFGGAPLNIVCDNCKTAVISHPRWGDIELNEEYLTFCEYYGIVMKPANVRKPKEKASVEGSVGKIATKIIAKLRNETFYSLNALNEAILKELDLLNNTNFQKRSGTRNSVFEMEERNYLRPLPLVPYEVSTWYFSLKVMYNSHISFKNNFYSVPYKYINKYVDVKIYKTQLNIYYQRELIATHVIVTNNEKNKYITNTPHLDQRKEFKKDTMDSLKAEALEIGEYTYRVVEKLFSEYKIQEQAFNSINNILKITKFYSPIVLEEACKKALEVYSFPHYKQIIEIIKNNEKKQESIDKSDDTKNMRGSEYYK